MHVAIDEKLGVITVRRQPLAMSLGCIGTFKDKPARGGNSKLGEPSVTLLWSIRFSHVLSNENRREDSLKVMPHAA